MEAEKEDYARKAVMGMRSLFHYKMKLVPIGEMVEVLTASMKVPSTCLPSPVFSLRLDIASIQACSIKRNGWVRIKRGKYKGDLAQIVEPDEAQSQAQVRLVPRIDLQAPSHQRSRSFTSCRRMLLELSCSSCQLSPTGAI